MSGYKFSQDEGYNVGNEEVCTECGENVGTNWDGCETCGDSEEGQARFAAWSEDQVVEDVIAPNYTPVWFENGKVVSIYTIIDQRVKGRQERQIKSVVTAQNPCPACRQELGQNFFKCDICADSKEGELALEIYQDRLLEIDFGLF